MAHIRGFRTLALAACAAALAGCSNLNETGGIRNAVGLAGSSPDEFLVVSKAPLVMPPDMNLRPPRAGAPDLGEIDLRAQARSSVTGAQQGAVAEAGTSAGEMAILSRANAHQANPSVRDELLADEGAVRADARVLDTILGREDELSEPLDPWSESDRLRQQTSGAPSSAGTGQATAPQQSGGQPTSILLEDILGGGSAAN